MHLRRDAVAACHLRMTRFTSPMWRMVVERSSFRPARTDDVIALDESWLEAVTAWPRRVIGTVRGRRSSAIDARPGTFRGIREGSDLVAVAGSHVFSPGLGVCAIGNVYASRSSPARARPRDQRSPARDRSSDTYDRVERQPGERRPARL